METTRNLSQQSFTVVYATNHDMEMERDFATEHMILVDWAHEARTIFYYLADKETHAVSLIMLV